MPNMAVQTNSAGDSLSIGFELSTSAESSNETEMTPAIVEVSEIEMLSAVRHRPAAEF